MSTTETAGETPKKIGPMPTGRRWEGLPVPFYFNEESADAFREFDMRPDDVIMSSLGKSGTTWVHKILFLLLHGMDDEGKLIEEPEGQFHIGESGQIYPEALPLEAPPEPRMFFGSAKLGDLIDQPAPRLISTHMFGQWLPKKLLAADGCGRLVLVMRNLKDMLASLHFFRGEAKDGWLGNEHGPGSLARWVVEDSPNAYGSVFRIIKDNQAVVDALTPCGRVIVLYYEELKLGTSAEIERLAEFLGMKLTAAKRDALAAAVDFNAMKNASDTGKPGAPASMLLRKGDIGDWKNHMDQEKWAEVDKAFDERLGDVKIAEPLKTYHVF